MSTADELGRPDVRRVLVPVDGEGASLTAVDHAAAVAAEYGADIHALYVYGPEQAKLIEDGDAEHDAIAGEAQSVLDGVRDACEDRAASFTCSTAVGFSTSRLAQHPGSVVLDIAEDVGADLLVISRERESEAPAMLEKAAEYVAAYASQPVLSV